MSSKQRSHSWHPTLERTHFWEPLMVTNVGGHPGYSQTVMPRLPPERATLVVVHVNETSSGEQEGDKSEDKQHSRKYTKKKKKQRGGKA